MYTGRDKCTIKIGKTLGKLFIVYRNTIVVRYNNKYFLRNIFFDYAKGTVWLKGGMVIAERLESSSMCEGAQNKEKVRKFVV